MSHVAQNTLVSVAVIAIGLAACVVDARTRRIPNALTLGAALGGFLIQIVSGGFAGALAAASGWLVGTLLLLPIFVLGGMGGGDFKLLAALGAWLGPRETLWLAAYSAIAGGALGVIVAVTHGYLLTALRNILAMLAYWCTVGIRPVPNLTLDSAKTPRLAYAIPIFAGTVMTVWR
jgi:prepilin peptidase CpaA